MAYLYLKLNIISVVSRAVLKRAIRALGCMSFSNPTMMPTDLDAYCTHGWSWFNSWVIIMLKTPDVCSLTDMSFRATRFQFPGLQFHLRLIVHKYILKIPNFFLFKQMIQLPCTFVYAYIIMMLSSGRDGCR